MGVLAAELIEARGCCVHTVGGQTLPAARPFLPALKEGCLALASGLAHC